MRHGLARRWEAEHRNEAFWASAGRSSINAAYQHDLQAEIMEELGGYCGTCLCDLRKAYEMVSWPVLAHEAEQTNFPATILLLCLEVYGSPRTVRMHGSLSVFIEITQSIMAGCSFATTALKVLLYRSVVRLALLHPAVVLRVFVDDTSLQWCGMRLAEAGKLTLAVVDVLAMFKELSLVANVKKCALVVSCAKLQRALQGGFAKHCKIPVRKNARNLGHDCAGTRAKARRAIAAVRVDAATKRSPRMTKLIKAAGIKGRKIIGSGLNSSAMHSAAVSGVNDRELRTARTAAARAAGLRDHVSHSVQFVLSPDFGMDPLVKGTVPLVRQLWTLGWQHGFNFAQARRAWASIEARLRSSPIWSSARGPLSAAALSLKRLGWGMEGPFAVHHPLGEKMHSTATCPVELVKLLEGSIVDWQMQRVAEHAGVAGLVPWAAPFKSLVRAGSLLSPSLQGAIAVVAGGDAWCREKLFAAGRASSPVCVACGSEPDTMLHRNFKCQAVEGTEIAKEFSELRQTVQQHIRAGNISDSQKWFFSYGLVQQPEVSRPVELAAATVKGSQLHRLAGNIYTDGSGYEPTHKELMRCGWSYVLLDEKLEVARAKHGPLEGPWQTVPKAEATALKVLLYDMLEETRRLGPVEGGATVLSDCKVVVDDYNCGDGSPAEASRANATVWRSILALRGGLAGLGQHVRVQWIPAHKTLKDVQQGLLSLHDLVGNDHADAEAREGAAVHRVPEVQRRIFLGVLQQAKELLRYVGGLHIHINATQNWVDEEWVQVVAKPPKAEALVFVKHVLESCEGGLYCVRCRRRAAGPSARDDIFKHECVPFLTCAAEEGESAKVHGSHVLWTSGGMVWCRRCGSYSSGGKWAKGLTAACKAPSVAGKRAVSGLLRGKHPRSDMKHLYLGKPQPMNVET